MIRLMCSTDRQEVEALKTTLFRAGIPSEIQSNALAHAMGINRLEVHVHERDLLRASKVRQKLQSAEGGDPGCDDPVSEVRTNALAEIKKPELVLEPKAIPFPSFEQARAEGPDSKPAPGKSESGTEFAQATALLEKEV